MKKADGLQIENLLFEAITMNFVNISVNIQHVSTRLTSRMEKKPMHVIEGYKGKREFL